MSVPKDVLRLKERLTRQVEEFFQAHRPEDARLVLDSTGPSLTKHYLVLQAIGLDRLSRIKEIHAFSGGVWAYFGYLALISGNSKHSYEGYGTPNVESAMRRFHHNGVFGPLRALGRLATKKSAFGSSQPLRDLLGFYFKEDYLNQTLDKFSPNIHLYLGMKGAVDPLAVSIASLADATNSSVQPLRAMPIADLIALATKVPFVYGKHDRSDPYFDAAYTRGYLNTLKHVSRGEQGVLVSTPWKSGQKGAITFVNCFSGSNPKLDMASDFAKLILNIPNKTYGHDIAGAFLR